MTQVLSLTPPIQTTAELVGELNEKLKQKGSSWMTSALSLLDRGEEKESIIGQIADSAINKQLASAYELIKLNLSKKKSPPTLREWGLILNVMKRSLCNGLKTSSLKSPEILELNNLRQIYELTETQVAQDSQVNVGAIRLVAGARQYPVSLCSETVDFKVSLMQFGTGSSYLHAGLIVGEKKSLEIEDIFSRHYRGPLSLQNYMESDFYNLNWKTLVVPSEQEKLSKKYGAQWPQVVQNMYEVALKKVQSETKFSVLYNSPSHMLASVFKFHRLSSPNDPKAAVEADPNVFCSEFAGRMTFKALVELEAMLQQEVGEAQGGSCWISNPFHSENFEALDPGRLAEVILPYTTPVPRAPLLQKLADWTTEAVGALPTPISYNRDGSVQIKS